jgi:hypothetical protein
MSKNFSFMAGSTETTMSFLDSRSNLDCREDSALDAAFVLPGHQVDEEIRCCFGPAHKFYTGIGGANAQIQR